MRLLVGGTLALIGVAIASGLHGAYKDAQINVQRRTGSLPPRWTDANRWEKD